MSSIDCCGGCTGVPSNSHACHQSTVAVAVPVPSNSHACHQSTVAVAVPVPSNRHACHQSTVAVAVPVPSNRHACHQSTVAVAVPVFLLTATHVINRLLRWLYRFLLTATHVINVTSKQTTRGCVVRHVGPICRPYTCHCGSSYIAILIGSVTSVFLIDVTFL